MRCSFLPNNFGLDFTNGNFNFLKLPEAASMPELSESNGIKWMSSLEAKFEDAKDKKPTAEKLERLRREKVGPWNSNVATDYLVSVGVRSEN